LKQSTDVASATQAFEQKYERHAGAVQPARVQNANAFLAQYGGSTPNSGTVTASDGSSCGSASNGVVAGNIVQTALNLAWHTSSGHTGKDSATEAYKNAWRQYDGASDMTDCGAFVATVMISSGVDSSYPKVGTAIQKKYVESNNSKYSIINNITDTSQLQPGDILIYDDGSGNGHTMIYVGPQPEKFIAVDASLHDHTPQAAPNLNWMLSKPGVIVARVK
jgi:hypothetical protein